MTNRDSVTAIDPLRDVKKMVLVVIKELGCLSFSRSCVGTHIGIKCAHRMHSHAGAWERGDDCNLNIPRYVDTFEEEEEIDLMVVRKEREELKAQLTELETEMDGYLKEPGYGA